MIRDAVSELTFCTYFTDISMKLITNCTLPMHCREVLCLLRGKHKLYLLLGLLAFSEVGTNAAKSCKLIKLLGKKKKKKIENKQIKQS